MCSVRLIEPVDVLYLRGNHLFEGAGAYSAPLMPPWPSMAAGAIRARIFADFGVNPAVVQRKGEDLPEPLNRVLGTLEEPGSFALTHFGLAQQGVNGVEAIYPLPADLVVTGDEEKIENIYRLKSAHLPEGVRASNQTSEALLMQCKGQQKPLNDCWLTHAGMEQWIKGKTPEVSQLLRSGSLWKIDPRLGIALDSDRRTVEDGQLYTADTVSLSTGVGFIVAISGAEEILPAGGLLRLGGDGRGATMGECEWNAPQPDWDRMEEELQFRIVLSSPGIFPDGWRLPGQNREQLWRWGGVEAEVISASVGRNEVVSGWDLARWQPKIAQRVVPAGAVYTLRVQRGKVGELQNLIKQGLPLEDQQRRVEGFNRVMIANR